MFKIIPNLFRKKQLPKYEGEILQEDPENAPKFKKFPKVYPKRIPECKAPKKPYTSLFDLVGEKYNLTPNLARKLVYNMLSRARSNYDISVTTGLDEDLIALVRTDLYVRFVGM